MLCQRSSSATTGVVAPPFWLPIQSTALWGLLRGKLTPSQPDPTHTLVFFYLVNKLPAARSSPASNQLYSPGPAKFSRLAESSFQPEDKKQIVLTAAVAYQRFITEGSLAASHSLNGMKQIVSLLSCSLSFPRICCYKKKNEIIQKEWSLLQPELNIKGDLPSKP